MSAVLPPGQGIGPYPETFFDCRFGCGFKGWSGKSLASHHKSCRLNPQRYVHPPRPRPQKHRELTDEERRI